MLQQKVHVYEILSIALIFIAAISQGDAKRVDDNNGCAINFLSNSKVWGSTV